MFFVDPLGATEFDIELKVLYFLENLHLLVILKCLVHYLGIAIDYCSCLCGAQVVWHEEEILVLINPRCLSPWSCLMFA